MITDPFLKLTISSPKQHGKMANDNSFTDSKITGHGIKQIQLAKFRASKLYATGTYYGKHEHGMLLLNALNETPSLSLFQKHIDKMIPSMQYGKLY
jgi:hypothetical protein